jgi:glycosyltransferase involved in cell wall biosynthesis
MNTGDFDIVIPTIGRPSFARLLVSLAAAASDGPWPQAIIVVDDRREPATPLPVAPAGELAGRVRVVKGRAAGPASARNIGWRASTKKWVAFLDDDVVVPPSWLSDLERDLFDLNDNVGASQGRINVPLPEDRRPSDWDRNVAGLERALWATADMAYRRSVLEEVNGFDERFPRAYREDADLGLRVCAAAYEIVSGERYIVHPVRPADRWVSVRLQKGNADDALMQRLHGKSWRERARVPRGRFRHHAFSVAALAGAVALRIAGCRRLAQLVATMWAADTVQFIWLRIKDGPKTPDEVVTMAATSLVIPPAAVYHRIKGEVNVRKELVS